MKTKRMKEIQDEITANRKWSRYQKFMVLGLNRECPGFADDVILIDRQRDDWEVFSGEFRQGTRISRDKNYREICEEYLEEECAGEDVSEPEEDLYDDSYWKDMDDSNVESTVLMPEDASFVGPRKMVKVSYGVDDDERGDEEPWLSDSYTIIGAPYELSFHINRGMDGIILDKDFFDFPLVCWNTGSRPIKADGEWIPADKFLVLPPESSRREERRLRNEKIGALLICDSKAKIGENEQVLLAHGCPDEDAHALAGFFWRQSIFYRTEDYDSADHAAWMDRLRSEGKPRPET